ncbi:DUF4224 domain-containing protein [Undibacterium sp. Di24W]
MLNNYLSAPELADLIDCKPNSYACMCRWLDRNGWPYSKSVTGMPKVSRTFHDAKMTGQISVPAEQEPDFGALAA